MYSWTYVQYHVSKQNSSQWKDTREWCWYWEGWERSITKVLYDHDTLAESILVTTDKHGIHCNLHSTTPSSESVLPFFWKFCSHWVLEMLYMGDMQCSSVVCWEHMFTMSDASPSHLTSMCFQQRSWVYLTVTSSLKKHVVSTGLRQTVDGRGRANCNHGASIWEVSRNFWCGHKTLLP